MSEQQQSWVRAAHRSGVRKKSRVSLASSHEAAVAAARAWRCLQRYSEREAKRGPPSPEECRPCERKSANGYCVQVRGAFDLVAVSCRGVPKTPGREESHQARFQVAGETSSPQHGVPSSSTTGSHASRWQAQHESEVVPAVCCVAQLTVKRRLMSCVRSSFQQLMQIDDLRSMSGAACSATNSRLPQRG